MDRPLATQLVGSYSKPNWLMRHKKVTTPYKDDSFWRPDPKVLQEAQDDATLLAIADQERAGLDLITDGEQRRQRFDSYFLRHLEGVDVDQLGPWTMANRDLSFIELDPEVEKRLAQAEAPRVVGKVGWPESSVTLEDARFLRRHTDRPVKMTVIGPLTTACRLANEYYPDEATLGMAVAEGVNRELRVLDDEGVDVVQLDEPDFHFRHEAAVSWGTQVLDVAFDGIRATKAVHICYGYATIGDKKVDPHYGAALEAIAASNVDWICMEYEQPGHEPDVLRHCGDKRVILGLLDLSTHEVKEPEYIARRARAALTVLPPERLSLAPDCGMWFLPREVAFAKLKSLVAAAEIVRRELGL